MPPPDRALNDGFAVVAQALSSAPEAFTELPAQNGIEDTTAVWDQFATLGIMAPAQPARGLICDGCEQTCFMPVEVMPAYNYAFVNCDKTPNMGRITVDPNDLRRWRCSVEQMAHWLAGLLKTNRTPAPYDASGAYSLGSCDIGGKSCEIILSQKTAPEGIRGHHLCLVIDPRAAPDQSTVRLCDLVVFADGQAHIRKSVLSDTLQTDPKGTVAKITYTGTVIQLVNTKTGESRILAEPDFNGTNAQLFDVLFGKADQTMTVPALFAAARVETVKPMSKVLDELGFKGAIRTAFLEHSKRGIRFRRSVTAQELKDKHIDLKELFAPSAVTIRRKPK